MKAGILVEALTDTINTIHCNGENAKLIIELKKNLIKRIKEDDERIAREEAFLHSVMDADMGQK